MQHVDVMLYLFSEPKMPAGASCVRFEDINLDDYLVPGKLYGLGLCPESSFKVYDGPPGGAKTRQTAQMVSCPCPCLTPDGGICHLHMTNGQCKCYNVIYLLMADAYKLLSVAFICIMKIQNSLQDPHPDDKCLVKTQPMYYNFYDNFSLNCTPPVD